MPGLRENCFCSAGARDGEGRGGEAACVVGGVGWDGMEWDGMGWDGMGWNGMDGMNGWNGMDGEGG